ncbi:MAG: hypothetical protein V3U63_11205 [Gemmatimonadota bacterium]
MAGIKKLKVVRIVVRPDRRSAYTSAWASYAGEVKAHGGRAWLFEDQALPGRFVEFTEFEPGDAGEGAEGAEGAVRLIHSLQRDAKLWAFCVRREGDDLVYREVRVGDA